VSIGVLTDSLVALANSICYLGVWNQLVLPWKVTVIVVIAAAAFLLATVALCRPPPWDAVLLGIGAVGSVVAWLTLVAMFMQAQGRYLLLGIASWALLLAWG